MECQKLVNAAWGGAYLLEFKRATYMLRPRAHAQAAPLSTGNTAMLFILSSHCVMLGSPMDLRLSLDCYGTPRMVPGSPPSQLQILSTGPDLQVSYTSSQFNLLSRLTRSGVTLGPLKLVNESIAQGVPQVSAVDAASD